MPKKTIKARMFDSLARWDESATEIGNREHVATMQGGSAMSAERTGDELRIYHHSAQGIATNALGDRSRRDSREMSQRTHLMTFHGANYDAVRDDDDGQLKVYRTPVTGLPSKTGLLGDRRIGDDAADESDRDFLSVFRQIREFEAAAAEKHARYVEALRRGDPVYQDLNRLESEARDALERYIKKLRDAFAKHRQEIVEVYKPHSIGGIPERGVGDARRSMSPVERWQVANERARRGERSPAEALRLEQDRLMAESK